jgi:hypothetical protein
MLGCAAQEEKQEKVSALESEVSQLAHSSESEIAALKLKLVWMMLIVHKS